MSKAAKRAALARLAPRPRAAVYEAGSTTRRTLDWRAPTVGPSLGVLSVLGLLRDRSRGAVRNDGYARGTLRSLVTNIVGTGIKPLSQAEDAGFRKSVHALWTLWTDDSDADGLLDWYGQQRQAVRCWLEAGEVFLRIRPRYVTDVGASGRPLAVPFQVQVIEPELCPHQYNGLAPNGNNIRAGIEFDRIGRRTAYWFYEQRPGDLIDWNQGVINPVPAESVIHLYDPERAGQVRGTPHLTTALVRLRELDKFDDATLVRQQLAAMFVAFLRRPAVEGNVDPFTGEEAVTDANGRPVLALKPGAFQELDPGEEVQFSDPPDVGGTYVDFLRQQLVSVAAATGVPYEVVTGDLSRVNDRTVRVILHEFRRLIQSWQHQVVAFQVCRRVWTAWLDRAYLAGALALPAAYAKNPEPWQRVKWMPQGWPYVHPVQDVQAAKEAIRCGFTSRSAEVSEQGEDAEVIDAEQAADNARADTLGLVYDSDGRVAVGKGLADTAEPAPEPAPAAAPPAKKGK